MSMHAARTAATRTRLRRGAVLTGLLAVASGIAVYSGTAGAAAQPTVSQVEAQVNSLQS